jgi:uncharacterized protein YecE (DUF72 family)
MANTGRIRVGIGGWSYAPWRETFYPPSVRRGHELEYASRQVTAIEVNGTFYRLQTPQTFGKWRRDTPDGFMFSLKAPRYVVQRKRLAEGESGIQRFLDSGIVDLGDKLGPILWQLAPTHPFDSEDLAVFLAMLPRAHSGLALRHALEPRHESFMCAEYLALARRHGIATVFADSRKYPSFADVTGEFIYARLLESHSSCETGYPAAALEVWAERARRWAAGAVPDGLPSVQPLAPAGAPREVFVYFINGAKERAPAAARELLRRLD